MSDEGTEKGRNGQVRDGDLGETGARERRASARVPITMWVEEITNGTQVFRRAGNLSTGGLYLDKTIPVPIGSKLILRFTLPGGGGEPVELVGQIVSIDPDEELGMGVKFMNLDDGIRSRIETYLTAIMGS